MKKYWKTTSLFMALALTSMACNFKATEPEPTPDHVFVPEIDSVAEIVDMGTIDSIAELPDTTLSIDITESTLPE